MENGISAGLKIDVRENRKFGVVVGGIFVAMALFSRWKNQTETPFAIVCFVLGSGLVLSGLVIPQFLTAVHKIWIKTGHALGWVNSRIILGILFFLVVLPIGLILRMMGKDGMKRTFDKNAKSYRTVSSETDPTEHMRRPF